MVENSYNKETMMKYLEVQRKSVMYNECDEVPEDNAQRPRRARRSRTQFDNAALEHLEAMFCLERYPDIHLREKIAGDIGVPEARVQTWFQNKRSRSRRSKVKDPELPNGSSNATVPSRISEVRTASIVSGSSKSPVKNVSVSYPHPSAADIKHKPTSKPSMTLPVKQSPYPKPVPCPVTSYNSFINPVKTEPTAAVVTSSVLTGTPSYIFSPYMGQNFLPVIPQYPTINGYHNITPPSSAHTSPSQLYSHVKTSPPKFEATSTSFSFPPLAHSKSSATWMTSSSRLPFVNSTSAFASTACQEAPLNLTTSGSPSSSGYDSPDSPLNVCD